MSLIALESFNSMLRQLAVHNHKHRGIFFVVNTGGRTDQVIGATNAGKSTILSALQDVLLGRENVSNIRREGFYRRLVIIPFTKAIPDSKRDPDIRSKLAKECNGILMRALEGLLRLIRNEYRLSEAKTTKADVERYRVESNSFLQ